MLNGNAEEGKNSVPGQWGRLLWSGSRDGAMVHCHGAMSANGLARVIMRRQLAQIDPSDSFTVSTIYGVWPLAMPISTFR